MTDFLLEVWARASSHKGSMVGHGLAGAFLFYLVGRHDTYTGEEAGVIVVLTVFLYREISDVIEYLVEHRQSLPRKKWVDGFTDLWVPVFVAMLLAAIFQGIG